MTCLQRPDIRRILVFRALHLGDLLCAVPALRALRLAAPQAHITLVGLPWAEDFRHRYRAWLDEFVAWPEHDAFLEGRSDELPWDRLTPLRARAFDLAIQLHGSGARSNALLAALAPTLRAGFYPEGNERPGDYFLPWRPREHEVLRWLRLMRHLGAPEAGTALEFPLSVAERAEARRLIEATGLPPRQYVCLHPGAKLRSRRWPLERFEAVGRALAHAGWALAITGSAQEQELTRALYRALRRIPGCRVVDCGGRTSLGGMAAFVANARLVISNDTGMSHVAAAVHTPSVIVASGGDVQRWAPLSRERHRVLAHDTPCRPCHFDECPYDHACAQGISSDAVIAAVRRALREPLPHAA